MGLFPFEPQVSTCCSRAGAGFRGTRSPSRRPLAAPQRARSGRVTDVVGERAARFHSQRAPSSPGVGAPGKAGGVLRGGVRPLHRKRGTSAFPGHVLRR